MRRVKQMKLRPTLWRTCRVLASNTRLQLLWLIFEEHEISVQEAAQRTGISSCNASNQLRALSARGFITPRRKKMRVFYRAEANTAVDAAPFLLNELKKCYDKNVSFRVIIRQATAFTHERRIEIAHALCDRTLTFQQLVETTGMSPSALSRHLDKLIDRGFVKRQENIYRSSAPGHTLGRALQKTVREIAPPSPQTS